MIAQAADPLTTMAAAAADHVVTSGLAGAAAEAAAVEGHVGAPLSDHDFWLGVGLAVSSSLFIGSSFIIKKKALIRLNRVGGLRASAGGFGYLREWMWWAGLITMGIGEAANFAAYAFAPASLVTPLGALSVIVSAVMSSHFLRERLNLLGKLGCVLCVLGSIVIVIHSPKEAEVDDLQLLLAKLADSTFITYVLVVLTVATFIGCYVAPRYGNSNVLVYVLLCASIGSLTVMSCKALGLALRDTLSGRANDFGQWVPYALLVTTVVFIAVQMNYLNRALDVFNTSIVTPIYYVVFTTLVIAASAILFKEWQHMGAVDIVGDACVFAIVIVAVVLLNGFQGMEVSWNDVRVMMRPKRDQKLHGPRSKDGDYRLADVRVMNGAGGHLALASAEGGQQAYGTTEMTRAL